jgi:hypothetical protein
MRETVRGDLELTYSTEPSGSVWYSAEAAGLAIHMLGNACSRRADSVVACRSPIRYRTEGTGEDACATISKYRGRVVTWSILQVTKRAILFNYFQELLDFRKIPPYIGVYFDRHPFDKLRAGSISIKNYELRVGAAVVL